MMQQYYDMARLQQKQFQHVSTLIMYGKVQFVQRLILRNSPQGAQVWHVLTRYHTVYLSPTRLSTSGMNHTCLFFPTRERHRTLASTHFPSH